MEASKDSDQKNGISDADKFMDLRGTKCPMNFVKTKVAMNAMKSGETLEVWLDDGEPADNVPRSTKLEGNKVLNQEKLGDYWTVLIEKA